MLANIIRNAKKAVGGGGGGIVTSDPYYSAVSLLLPMDGTNGSTTFTDSGPSALTVTAVGNAQISTTQSKYGGASVAFSGTTDRLGVASNALFAFGTGDFTVEFWVYFNSISTSFVQLYDTYVSGGFSFYWSGSTSTLIISNRSANQLSQAWSPSANTWYHLAVSRSGTSLKLFVNGTVLGSATASTSYAQAAIQIGGTADNASYTLNGYIDDLRVTKYARYTSAFAPPTQAHPNIYNPYTTLPVSGAALWLDASQQNTIFSDAGTTPVTTSGQSIYQWNDLSGNNRHAVQATSGNRPTWLPPASGQNGFGVANFNGSSSFFDTSMSLNGISSFSVFLVAKSATSGGWQSALRQQNYQGYFVMPWTSSGSVSPRILLDSDGGVTTTNTLTLTNGVFNLISFIRTSGTSNVANVNGSLSSTRSANSASLSASVNLVIGRCSQPVAEYFSGSIAEIVIFNQALSVSETASVESYLKTKWGTP